MKVLIVNKFYFPWLGGVETVVQQLAEGFAKIPGNEVVVLCCNSVNKNSEEKNNNVKVVRASSIGVFRSMPVSISFFSQFRKLSKNTDVIDLHHPFPLSFLSCFIFRPKAKIVVHYHSDIVRQKFLGFLLTPLIRWVFGRADTIIVTSQNLLDSSSMLEDFKSKCVVIPLAINIYAIDATRDDALQAKIKEDRGDYIIYAGRLSYYKGVEYLIRAAADISQKLLIIGEGAEKDKLQNLVATLNLQHKVSFINHVLKKEFYNYIRGAKVFVLPSIFRSEAFGIVLLEAMACGTPVISTELKTGTSFVNQHGITGMVIEPINVLALQQAIKHITNSESERVMMGRNARERVLEQFDEQKMINDTNKFFLM